MDAPEIGPITQAMYERQGDQPPALIREWGKKLGRPGEWIFLWMAAVRREPGVLGWGCMSTNFGNPGLESSWEGLRNMSAAGVERLLSPLAHEGRVRVMQALCEGPLSASELTKATGFQGGALYHHLKELHYAEYAASEAGRYRLTPRGLQMLITVLCIANEVIEDRGEQGLAISGWEERAKTGSPSA